MALKHFLAQLVAKKSKWSLRIKNCSQRTFILICKRASSISCLKMKLKRITFHRDFVGKCENGQAKISDGLYHFVIVSVPV